MRCKKHLSDTTSAVGVCATCLRERLLSLMAAQARAEAHEVQLSRLRSCAAAAAAEDLPRKSDPLPPPPLVFPRSVSPYVSRRKVEDSSWSFPSPLDDRHRRFHHRFYSTPQVGPTYYGGGISTSSFVTTGSVCRKQRSRFSFLSSLFRSRSENLDSVPRDSSHSTCEPASSSSSSSAWFSSMFSRRKKKQSKFCSIEEQMNQRKKPLPSRFFSRGMSPAGGASEADGDYGDRRDGSPSASGYSSESSKWKPSPAASHGSTARRGRQGLSRNVSGLAFCLSPLVRASPNHRHWNQKGLPPEFAYTGDVRVPTKPHLSEAASFCANRSRKLADFGRVNANR
ncbi:unnamed protein product [Citrullus colocynthis]|uniref:Uncharacterized protein n=1 Tax=Citrullus colocynthis TaxID=252529 RepID=A0ABP0ZCH0_9ROSI